MRALGAYIFAGGFTLGVQKHFEVLAHLEEGPYGVATARQNFPGLPIFVGPENWPDEPAYRDVDLLYGNPPCAAWSQANGKSVDNWRTDPRVDCTRRHFGLLEQHHPKVWIWESVAATFAKGREFIEGLVEAAMAEGYAVTLYVHDGKYLGLPHNRARFMFIAHRVKLDIPTPDWTTTTCGEALIQINDIGAPTSGSVSHMKAYGHLLKDAKAGEDLRTTWNRVVGKGRSEDELPRNAQGNVAGRPNFLMKRSRPDQPANTVMFDQVHPTEDRFLTLRELSHLCGYPADFVLAPGSQLQEYTRAVMPPVGEHVARMVRDALERDEPIGRPSAVVVDHRKPPGAIYPFQLGVAALSSSPQSSTPLRDAQPAAARPDPEPVGRGGPIPRPKPGVKRMAFLQVLIMMDRWTPGQMVEIVKHQWPESKASNADVSTQRAVLVTKGYVPPATRRTPAETLPW